MQYTTLDIRPPQQRTTDQAQQRSLQTSADGDVLKQNSIRNEAQTGADGSSAIVPLSSASGADRSSIGGGPSSPAEPQQGSVHSNSMSSSIRGHIAAPGLYKRHPFSASALEAVSISDFLGQQQSRADEQNSIEQQASVEQTGSTVHLHSPAASSRRSSQGQHSQAAPSSRSQSKVLSASCAESVADQDATVSYFGHAPFEIQRPDAREATASPVASDTALAPEASETAESDSAKLHGGVLEGISGSEDLNQQPSKGTSHKASAGEQQTTPAGKEDVTDPTATVSFWRSPPSRHASQHSLASTLARSAASNSCPSEDVQDSRSYGTGTESEGLSQPMSGARSANGQLSASEVSAPDADHDGTVSFGGHAPFELHGRSSTAAAAAAVASSEGSKSGKLRASSDKHSESHSQPVSGARSASGQLSAPEVSAPDADHDATVSFGGHAPFELQRRSSTAAAAAAEASSDGSESSRKLRASSDNCSENRPHPAPARQSASGQLSASVGSTKDAAHDATVSYGGHAPFELQHTDSGTAEVAAADSANTRCLQHAARLVEQPHCAANNARAGHCNGAAVSPVRQRHGCRS